MSIVATGFHLHIIGPYNRLDEVVVLQAKTQVKFRLLMILGFAA